MLQCYISGSENVHYLRLTEIKLLYVKRKAFAYYYYYVCFYASCVRVSKIVYVVDFVPTNLFTFVIFNADSQSAFVRRTVNMQ